MFQNILDMDPYRLDNLDTYSNLLYVLDLKKHLADLAHKVVNIDKYRVETCCVIGKQLFLDYPIFIVQILHTQDDANRRLLN